MSAQDYGFRKKRNQNPPEWSTWENNVIPIISLLVWSHLVTQECEVLPSSGHMTRVLSVWTELKDRLTEGPETHSPAGLKPQTFRSECDGLVCWSRMECKHVKGGVDEQLNQQQREELDWSCVHMWHLCVLFVSVTISDIQPNKCKHDFKCQKNYCETLQTKQFPPSCSFMEFVLPYVLCDSR